MDKVIKCMSLKDVAEVCIPASKSQAHRMLILAALADRDSRIVCETLNDDIERTADCLRALGCDIEYKDGCFFIHPIGKPRKGAMLDCGESGSTLRFLLPVAAAIGADASFNGHGKLPQRPLSPLYEEMERHGVVMTEQGKMPLSCKGKLSVGDYKLAANISSQFISGLLMALPLLEGTSKIKLTGKTESASYIKMTLAALNRFGAKIDFDDNVFIVYPLDKGCYLSSGEMNVEGDWSSAAFFIVLGTIVSSPNGIRLKGLNTTDSLQGDKAVVEIMQKMGADITEAGNDIVVRHSVLHAVEVDCSNIPDLVPILSVAAAMANGTTTFKNIARLRIKESDRVEAIKTMLGSFGVNGQSTEDTLTVEGGKTFNKEAVIDSFNDHRIAMSASVLAAAIEGGRTTILNSQCAAKSYPAFFFHLDSVKADK